QRNRVLTLARPLVATQHRPFPPFLPCVHRTRKQLDERRYIEHSKVDALACQWVYRVRGITNQNETFAAVVASVNQPQWELRTRCSGRNRPQSAIQRTRQFAS